MRIIAGIWRGRRFSVPEVAGLRPTPDRIRETLFNWLMHDIQGATCLDLFAGSGALGLEALSRGAASVVFVDQSKKVLAHLNKIITLLNINNAECYCNHAPSATIKFKQPFDLVFLDPPFRKNLLKPVIDWLIKQQLLADGALIYIEAESELASLPVPMAWQCLHQKVSGQVSYYLFAT